MTNKALNTSKYSIELAIGPETVCLPIVIRKHARSQRMVIRYQPIQHHVALTLPRYVTIRQGLHFIEEKRKWLEQQVREKIKHIPLSHGQTIPVFGSHYMLCHTGGRGVVGIEGDRIVVPGETEFMRRRVREWLKRQARQEILNLALAKAQQIEKPLKKISVRDTSSRWGSCSHDGNLSFSWRLVFAPYAILDYVVSHEVAHLSHHNHSPAFWSVVERLCPAHEQAQQWLRTHGPVLYAYG